MIQNNARRYCAIIIIILFSLPACQRNVQKTHTDLPDLLTYITSSVDWSNYSDVVGLDGTVIDDRGFGYEINASGELLVYTDKSLAAKNLDLGQYYPVSIALDSNGELVVLAIDPLMEAVLLVHDSARNAFGPAISLPTAAEKLYFGSGGFDLLLDTGVGVNGYSYTGVAKELFTWANVDIDVKGVKGLSIVDNGSILINSNGELYIATTIAKSDNKKTKLTLTCFGESSTISRMVAKFNASNTDYEIIPTYLSDGFENGAMNANPDAMTAFNTEIIAGKVPDIIVTYASFPIDIYVDKGLLIDLYPLLDADADLGGRAAILPDILRITDYDGSLYQISPYFTLDVVAGTKQSLGGATSWTISDAMALLNSNQTDAVVISQTPAWIALRSCIYDYVDYKSGTCSFDSPEFIEVLHYAMSFPIELKSVSFDNFGAVRDGSALAGNNNLFWDFSSHIAIAMQLGDEPVYIGYPGKSKNYISLPYGISISSACNEMAAAWEFVRMFLISPASDEFIAFPTNAEAFDRMAELAMVVKFDDEGNEIPRWQIQTDKTQVNVFSATQADIDAVKEIISLADKLIYDFRLNDIIRTDAEAFFAGIKSAEETARIIQSRVSIYLAEQKG